MRSSSPLRIGVDLGGTKTEAVVANVSTVGDTLTLDVVARERTPTDRGRGYAHVLANTADLIARVASAAGAPADTPIGVGMPGGVTFRTENGERSVHALIKNSNTTCLNGRAFHHELETLVGRPIAFSNDANCFALAEAELGAGRGARVMFGVILGTGVGGGVVFRSRDGERATVWGGLHGIAGEWGHVALDPVGGAPCYCGRRGCVETYLSGPAIEARYRALGGDARVLALIAQDVEADPRARQTIDETCERFGRAVAMVIDVLDPEIIVIGGGVSNVAAIYDRGVDEVRRWVFNDELRTRIVRNTLGDSAGVLGAALIA